MMRKSCKFHVLEKEGKMRLQERQIFKGFSSFLRVDLSGARGSLRPFGWLVPSIFFKGVGYMNGEWEIRYTVHLCNLIFVISEPVPRG